MLNAMICIALAVISANGRKIVDLTHTFDGDAPKFPLGSLGSGLENLVYFNVTTLAEQYYGDMW
jgi:hypothetical protein